MAAAAKGGRPRCEATHRKVLNTAMELVYELGFKAVSVEAIAAKSGVAKTTIYRRWPNKAAVIMDAFMMRVGSGTLFSQSETILESIRLQMRAMAKVFRGKDGDLMRGLLAEAQFDPDLAAAFQERWTLPRRAMAREVFQEAIKRGEIRKNIDVEAVIDMMYAPLYYRLQMRTGPLNMAYADEIFSHAMEGIRDV